MSWRSVACEIVVAFSFALSSLSNVGHQEVEIDIWRLPASSARQSVAITAAGAGIVARKDWCHFVNSDISDI